MTAKTRKNGFLYSIFFSCNPDPVASRCLEYGIIIISIINKGLIRMIMLTEMLKSLTNLLKQIEVTEIYCYFNLQPNILYIYNPLKERRLEKQRVFL
jgi:hypothetical protein